MGDYETDILLWSEHQAGLLRRMATGEQVNDQVDWTNVAEEVEALGRSDRRELHNRIATILLHLIKLQASPAAQPRLGWHDTIRTQRRGIRRLLKDSPSLKASIPRMISDELTEAKEEASISLAEHNEQPCVDLFGLDYTEDQVLGPWMP